MLQTQKPPQPKLTDDQIEHLIVAIGDLKDTNTMAAVIYTALQKSPSPDEKRKVLVTGFAQSFELMLVMNMGITSNKSPEEFQRDLLEVKRQNNAKSN